MRVEDIGKVVGMLSESDKVAVFQVGLETIWHALVVNNFGHTSLQGHCEYVREDSPLLIHTMLNALNGSDKAYKRLSESVVVGVFRPISEAMFDELVPKIYTGEENDSITD